MVRVTGNFQSESPLHPKAFALLETAFEAGWADPIKMGAHSARAAVLRNEALESIATSLNLRPHQIETFADQGLGFHLGLTGLLWQPSHLFHSAIDRSEVFAIAALHTSTVLSVGHDGKIIPTHGTNDRSVLALQIANGETGIIQDVSEVIENVNPQFIALDCTTSGHRVALPQRWDTALFNSRSWQGPAGVGILAISDRAHWQNPLPQTSASKTGLSAPLPLLMASAIALEESINTAREEDLRLRQLTNALRTELLKISDCDVAGDLSSSLPHLTSASFLYCHGEELLRMLAADGFTVDSGSACTSENIEPSHVLAAMGVLTHGNIRITLHSQTTHEEVLGLARSISSAVIRLRS